MRDIMDEIGDFQKVDEYIESKFEYKKILYPKKFKKTTKES